MKGIKYIIGIILVLVGIAIVLVKFGTKKTHETYVLPEGFHGNFRVVYGQPCGVKPKEEEGRLVFEIPENGILFITPALSESAIDARYYMLDAKGERRPLTEVGRNSSIIRVVSHTNAADGSNTLNYSSFCLYHTEKETPVNPATDPRLDSLMFAGRCK